MFKYLYGAMCETVHCAIVLYANAMLCPFHNRLYHKIKVFYFKLKLKFIHIIFSKLQNTVHSTRIQKFMTIKQRNTILNPKTE